MPYVHSTVQLLLQTNLCRHRNMNDRPATLQNTKVLGLLISNSTQGIRSSRDNIVCMEGCLKRARTTIVAFKQKIKLKFFLYYIYFMKCSVLLLGTGYIGTVIEIIQCLCLRHWQVYLPACLTYNSNTTSISVQDKQITVCVIYSYYYHLCFCTHTITEHQYTSIAKPNWLQINRYKSEVRSL